MDDLEQELKESFLEEASELLAKSESSFLNLETNPNEKSLLDHIFRLAHNLKGTSRAVGFGEMAELTHKAENLILKLKEGEIAVTPNIVTVLLSFNDRLNEMIMTLKMDVTAKFNNLDVETEIEKALSGELENQAKNEASLELAPQNSALEQVETIEVFASKNERTEVKKDPKKDDETIRVSLGRLEKLNDLVGELVILQTLVESSLSKVGENKTARSLGKLSKEIQDLSMSLRMIAVGPTFQKLSRIVRDTSKILGKKIDLRILGEDTEIDKVVAESLSDPLVHIIRNAIDHGVESPEARIAAGKREEGIVEVLASHEGNFLIIQITDDGNGIDGSKLIERAKAKGLVPRDAIMTEQQGIELIFHPGFSTKDQVTEVSGRGVGMDVVKTNIEALGGEVKVRSQLGVGSCFRLMLPLTLAIIEGMLIESGGQTYVIPKIQIQEVNRVDESKFFNSPGRPPYFKLRDQVIPFFYLENELGFVRSTKSEIAIIVKNGDQHFAVGVSEIFRQQQVVVKPPTKEIIGRTGIMGTTILGDGKPALIVDLLNLYGKKVRKDTLVNTTTKTVTAA